MDISMVMTWLMWFGIGTAAGWLVSLSMRPPRDFITYIVVGNIGAFLAGLGFDVLGASEVVGFTMRSIPVALAGAVILLAALRLLVGGGRANA
jgi:uncharacterized membrane protein YeaQ/YmgE (transglycosylase-associated protein family)